MCCMLMIALPLVLGRGAKNPNTLGKFLFQLPDQKKTNHAKTQIWKLHESDPREFGVVLGVVFADFPQPTIGEVKRHDEVATKAHRISALPAAIPLRSKLAGAILTPRQVWDQLVTGRSNHTVFQNWAKILRFACLRHPGGRSSRSLEPLFRWGKRGDLGFVGVQRVLSGLHEWWVKSGRFFRSLL